MLHYEQVFGNVFERRESKCCEVLMKLCRKVNSEHAIILRMDQQLKIKNISDASGKLFCRHCKDKLIFVRDRLNVLMIKINFNLLKVLSKNSVNIKHQGKSSN